MVTDFDVAVVGYGPTGLVLSSLLGRAGHRVAVFERWPGLYGLPRLTHIDGETARIVQACGDVEFALRDASAKECYEWRNGAGDLLIAVDWSGESSGFAAHYSMYQPDIESAIDQRVRSYPNVEINQGVGVVAVETEPDHVALVIRPWSRDRDEQWSAGAQDRKVTARYVVGADGANSSVRNAVGIGRLDLGVDDRWLNLDTECLHPLGPDFEVTRQFCDPARPNMFMPIGRSRQRFEVAVLPDDDADEMETEDFAWQWFRERHGLGPSDLRILRQIIYTFSARTAQSWRQGRVLLAGDAAHTMPPYMGQGACSGMRDGITLAWKLDLVLTGRSGDELLDTYEAERRPHVEVIQHCAVELGKVANLKDPAAAAARDAAFQRGEIPPLPSFPTITAGVIATAPDRSPQPLAGTLSPQGVISADGRVGRFDDVLGWGFSVVTMRDPRTVLDDDQLSFLTELGAIIATLEPDCPGSFIDVADTYRTFLNVNGIEVYIARPDFHLYGAGSLSQLPDLVDSLRSALFFQREFLQQESTADADLVAQ
ncbi:bifunctional 3-(3-hydroxy-phenyl)propionate/3-hydroxycinnamic acid hydroxylase [Skermania sp. ID1734]|uniref:bifunctional 3-(3-hydroxy-phenyl)propionate/3-hydroxycinnamic acid hydroxylase MhpA n=1 Tax=Skermania sp. ID1734 TaxID=2597516 RepID=UPI0011805841|nr:bifunctional 3-(3-hydroxy-phenyl)propionate/3-hydroxycinnamic acid hydroxylase [Skermania sp. ID1734]TSD93628.1 bifunctional 3-(3-hydroxy-phenyl)propionate/3-hydroxycinnamic acid hydroxylase [Skermania sp. ID1734]